MRLGCGCLLGLVAMVGVLGGVGWMAFRALQPSTVAITTPTAEDGRRAQEKIYDIVRRRRTSVVLTEGELNAFLTRHLVHAGDLPLTDFSVRLPARDRVEFSGRMPLRSLLADSPLAKAGALLPSAWFEWPVGVSIAGRVRLESGKGEKRYLRVSVERFAVGRQALPGFCARLLLDPSAVGLLRWRLPSGVEDVTVEPGRAVVRTAS